MSLANERCNQEKVIEQLKAESAPCVGQSDTGSDGRSLREFPPSCGRTIDSFAQVQGEIGLPLENARPVRRASRRTRSHVDLVLKFLVGGAGLELRLR